MNLPKVTPCELYEQIQQPIETKTAVLLLSLFRSFFFVVHYFDKTNMNAVAGWFSGYPMGANDKNQRATKHR